MSSPELFLGKPPSTLDQNSAEEDIFHPHSASDHGNLLENPLLPHLPAPETCVSFEDIKNNVDIESDPYEMLLTVISAQNLVENTLFYFTSAPRLSINLPTSSFSVSLSSELTSGDPCWSNEWRVSNVRPNTTVIFRFLLHLLSLFLSPVSFFHTVFNPFFPLFSATDGSVQVQRECESFHGGEFSTEYRLFQWRSR